MPHPAFSELRARLQEVHDLRAAAAVLSWDQATYMPSGGAEARARQIAMLERLAHERLIHPRTGDLLAELAPSLAGFSPDDVDAALVRVALRDFSRAVRVPPAFTERLSAHCAHTYQVWTEARPANDFSRVVPLLEQTLALSRELSSFFPGSEHIADPLIDYTDEGMKTARLRGLFAELRRELVPLVDSVAVQPAADDRCLRQHFPESDQLAFGWEVILRFGFDPRRGRQDKTPHPFMTAFSLGDVRITTRVREDDLGECLFSTLHEAGHAIYEQGIHAQFEGTPLASGASAGIHESQSRLWENQVGRSRAFWEYFYPRLQRVFPVPLHGVSLDQFYRAINKVERSLIRTAADELTYNLHVMLRFDLELAMLEGDLAIRDLPEAWRERMRADLGVVVPDDCHGVLQDVHWYGGVIGGAFQCYTLGNLLAAQLFECAISAHPSIPEEIARGHFETLLSWLRNNVHQYGRALQADDLILRATGQPLSIAPFLRYLKRKFGELYRLDGCR